jgi:hypothetical protein
VKKSDLEVGVRYAWCESQRGTPKEVILVSREPEVHGRSTKFSGNYDVGTGGGRLTRSSVEIAFLSHGEERVFVVPYSQLLRTWEAQSALVEQWAARAAELAARERALDATWSEGYLLKFSRVNEMLLAEGREVLPAWCASSRSSSHNLPESVLDFILERGGER